MTLTPRHEEVEAGFRALLESADVDAPDAVGYEPDAVVFYWHEPKLAVFVDFDDNGVASKSDHHATSGL